MLQARKRTENSLASMGPAEENNLVNYGLGERKQRMVYSGVRQPYSVFCWPL